MRQLDPNTKRLLKAREIYQNTFSKFMVLGCVVLIFVPIAIELLFRWLGFGNSIGKFTNPGILGVGIAILLGVAHNRAISALKHAGLLREESETIERTAATFQGETLEVRESSVWERAAVVALLLLVGAVSLWLCQSRPTDWPVVVICGAGAIVVLCWSLLITANIKRPELHLNNEGITSFQGWMKPKVVRWEEIANIHIKRVWGLPPSYSLEGKATETISLQDKAGKPLLFLSVGNTASGVVGAMASVWTDNSNASKPTNALSTQRQRFVAEIKQRLVKEETFDG